MVSGWTVDVKRFFAEDRSEESERLDPRRLLGVRVTSPSMADGPNHRWRRGDPSLNVGVAEAFDCSVCIGGTAICVDLVAAKTVCRMS